MGNWPWERVCSLCLRVGEQVLTAYVQNKGSEYPALLDSLGMLLEGAPLGDSNVLQCPRSEPEWYSVTGLLCKPQFGHNKIIFEPNVVHKCMAPGFCNRIIRSAAVCSGHSSEESK